jgi:hypothetical protein
MIITEQQAWCSAAMVPYGCFQRALDCNLAELAGYLAAR